MTLCAGCGTELTPPFRFCPRCGRPASFAEASPFYAPTPEPAAPRPGRHSGALLALLAVLIVVGASLATAGVIYFAAAGVGQLGRNLAGTKPVITLTVNTLSSVGVDILVSGIQPATAPANLKMNLAMNGSYGTATALGSPGSSVYLYVLGYPFSITWQNPGGSGSVSQGDHFTVLYPYVYGVPSPGTYLYFVLVWTDGSTLAYASWSA